MIQKDWTIKIVNYEKLSVYIKIYIIKNIIKNDLKLSGSKSKCLK